MFGNKLLWCCKTSLFIHTHNQFDQFCSIVHLDGTPKLEIHTLGWDLQTRDPYTWMGPPN